MKYLLVRLAAVSIMIVLGSIPIYAQQAGLTLEQLAGRIEVLFSGQTYLTHRIAALETAVAASSKQTVVQVVTRHSHAHFYANPCPGNANRHTDTPALILSSNEHSQTNAHPYIHT